VKASGGAASPGASATGAAASGGAAGAAVTPRRDNTGYALVAASFLIWGAIGALVRLTTMPESVLIVARMVIAATLVGLVFARPPMLAELRDRRTAGWLVLMGVFSASTLLLFFLALRLTDVAIGMFLLFTGPVYVALVAPRLLHQRPDRVVYPALALAVAGMAAILLPGLLGAQRVSLAGIACGVATGFLYTGYALTTKYLTKTRRSVTIALSEMVLDALFLLPLAVWQLAGTGYHLSRHDLVVVLVLGVACTAIPYVMYVEGLRRIRVEHASILGYLEPVSAPLYALVLLGETTATATIAGGALIVAAGVLVVVFGSPEQDVGDVPPA
jgi:drug/metabolite transporter (DMT)-like permease